MAQHVYIIRCNHGIASQTGSEHMQSYPARVNIMSQWLAFVFGLFLTIPGLLTSSQDYVAIVLKLRSGQIWQLASVCHPFVTHKRPDAMCLPGSRSLAGLRALAGAATQRVCSQLYFFGAHHWLGPHAAYTCICFMLSAGEASWPNKFCGSLWTCRL